MVELDHLSCQETVLNVNTIYFLPSKDGSEISGLDLIDEPNENHNFKDFLKTLLQSDAMKQVTLVVNVKRVYGTVTVHLPSPPTDRIWVGFRCPPQLDFDLLPTLGDLSLTLGSDKKEFSYLRPIITYLHHMINEAVLKSYVYPNLKDIVIPILGTPPWARKFARVSKPHLTEKATQDKRME